MKTKHEELTRLALIYLVPGPEKVINHVCIWCIIAVDRAILGNGIAIYELLFLPLISSAELSKKDGIIYHENYV